MSNPSDNANDPLEGLLRRWGGEEAALSTEVKPAPAARGGRLRALPWSLVLRWAPLAAAAVLLIATVVFHAVHTPVPGEGPVRPIIEDVGAARLPPPGWVDPNEVRKLRDEAAEMRKQAQDLDRQLRAFAGVKDRLDGLEKDLADARGQLDGEKKRHGTDVQELAATLKARDAELQLIQTKAKDLLGRLEAMEKEKAEWKVPADELANLKTRTAGLEGRLTATADELQRAQKQLQDADKTRDEIRRELAAAKTRADQLIRVSQQTYLAVVAPSEEGLRACQVAARSRRLTDRLTALRGEVRSDPALRLMGKVEVLLVRLDVLNADDPAAVASFSKLLAGGDVLAQIDTLAAAEGESPAIRNWLFEARLVLTGAQHAG